MKVLTVSAIVHPLEFDLLVSMLTFLLLSLIFQESHIFFKVSKQSVQWDKPQFLIPATVVRSNTVFDIYYIPSLLILDLLYSQAALP